MKLFALFALIGALALPQAALAQSDGGAARFPAIFGIPSAFPAPGGTGYAGLVLVHPRRGAARHDTLIDNLDGDLVLGYTLGHPVRGVSVSLGATITSLKGFGQDGALQVSLSRALLVRPNSLTFGGLSAFNLAAWGDAANSPPGYSLHVSHLTTLPLAPAGMPVQITLGYGDQVAPAGRGRSYDRVPFAGIGLGLSGTMSASIAATPDEIYTGIGFGLATLPRWSFSLGAYDVTQRQGRRQIALTMARSF